MTWDVSYTKKLRYLIGDTGVTSTYTDTQLQFFLAISADYVFEALSVYDIGGPYVVNISGATATIVPDPETGGPVAVGNLICLHAAVLINRSEIKLLLASGGIKVTDNKSTIDLSGQLSAAKIKQGLGFDSSYKDTLREYEMGNRYAGCGIFATYQAN
jgi:hypothetical protein